MQHKLYALRKNKDITQEVMANELNITTFTYRKKEKSLSPFNADQMFAIARYFDTDINDIFLPRG